ncbi:UDP-N-acetylmuramate dehydrogenase [Fibrobacter sp. UWH9]|uniref:UDP-N-acetylmuramate dehydrogenase n=1 Tax=unclassified Fibrobacter TaxID=2634177 RepID=UPI000919B800|nr:MULTISPECIES: UDP-N-acetylmuramate dehydrogenase [unclassified Fibrobacter]OWV07687.1 UDP-N-acetylenolpyruvoylglucosamine reductase [Fibrobacter sp. UWH3]SHG74592.1 UDP-N-acetylmuramate dehydrogenase [Fibrobacter sp. UWH9]SHK54794.1 UDP-N-acetylmuramate dehydrogenase [Fibrobacter sp. UWH6]
MVILENEPMSRHTSFKVGGEARYFFKVESVDEILDVRKRLADQNLPFFVLGNGTNLLVSDKGFGGGIITLGKSFSEVQDLGNGKFKVGAGVSLGAFARKSIKMGYSGIHKLAGIPGTLGGAIYMNAGAYGQEICQTCVEVESLDANGTVHTRTAAQCDFGYRHSGFQVSSDDRAKGQAEIILSATFQLEPAEMSGKDSYTLETEMQECMAKRKASQPLNMPNAGSTFKRLDVGAEDMPQQIAPGYYIEQAGLKGYRIGGAEVSTVHANFIVNADNATASDIKALSEYVQQKVFEKFGIQLKREIILLGG